MQHPRGTATGSRTHSRDLVDAVSTASRIWIDRAIWGKSAEGEQRVFGSGWRRRKRKGDRGWQKKKAGMAEGSDSPSSRRVMRSEEGGEDPSR